MGNLADKIAKLESKRNEALANQDAPSYYSLCEQLGLSESDIEDFHLYEIGLASLQAGFQELSFEIQDDPKLDWNALAEIALPDFRIKDQKYVKQRLGKLRGLGYDVPNYGSLRKDTLFQLYAGIKDDIYQNTGPEVRARITAENAQSREERRLLR